MKRKVLLSSMILAGCAGAAATTSTIVPGRYGAWPDEGPFKWAPRPTETAITANDLRTRLYQIADDSMGGRPMGSLGNYKTTAYIAREFERLGLKPGGDNGTWFQVLGYGAYAYDSTAATLSVGGQRLVTKRDWMPVTPVERNSIGGVASVQNVPTVFAGRWGDESQALSADALRGKVAVFTMPSLPARVGNRQPTRGVGQFASVMDPRAHAAGAAGILVVSLDSVSAAQINSVFNTRNGMFPQGSGEPAAAISQAAAERIFGRPISQVAVGTTGQPVTAQWELKTTLSEHPARNVIAILPGSDPARAGEYVLVGAHNDHVQPLPTAVDHDSLRAYNKVIRPQGANDRPRTPTAEEQARIDAMIAHARSVRPARRDSIMNGADDDGSGTVVLLELAERFAKEKPARSIIFISHQGEEAGLLGSQWFVEHPTVPLKSIVAAHNMDMVGKGRVTDVKFGGPNSVQTLGARRISPQFGDIIDSVNAIIAEPMALDKSWDVPANPLNRFCRSDQVNYVNNDIPTTYFSLGYASDYHQATDEPQYVDYDHTARLGRFLYEVMTAVANRQDRPFIAGQDTLYPSCR